MRVFLTGGTGLVGSHVAERLVGGGHEVVALVRSTSDVTFLEALGVRLVVGDVTEEGPGLAAAMRGCDAVLHAAAVVYRGEPEAEYLRVNVGGTERVLAAAGAAGVPRAVHVSSIAVYGEISGRARIVEEDWRSGEIPRGNVYARTKREAEEVAWRLHGRGLVRVTTVRPGVVYGERDRLFTPRLARVARARLLPLPGGGHRPVPVVYAGRVAEAVASVLGRPEAAGRAYNLSSDHPPFSARSLLETFGRALGRAPRVVPVPAGLARAGAWLVAALAGRLPAVVAPSVRRGVRLLVDGNPIDDGRARRELEWPGGDPPPETLARTARWYLEAYEQGAGR